MYVLKAERGRNRSYLMLLYQLEMFLYETTVSKVFFILFFNMKTGGAFNFTCSQIVSSGTFFFAI